MTNLSVFQFESHQVRFVGTAENPEWVAADICQCLGLSNPSRALSSLKDDEKGITLGNTLGGTQELLTVKELGLYRLIFKSRKEQAEKFKRWVFEVIATIRKTGSYSVAPESRQLPPVRDVVEYLQAAKDIPTIANPIIRSALEQRLAEELGANRALPGSDSSDLVLVSVLAREMGYQLEPGQDARKHHEPAGQAQHGRYSVNVYDRTAIAETVRAFFR